MQGTLKAIILVNLYWVSLVLIGYSIISFLAQYSRNRQLAIIATKVCRQHIFTIALVSFAVTSFCFAVAALPLYIFNISPIVLTSVYWIFIIASIVWGAIRIGKNLFSTSDLNLFGLSRQPLIGKVLMTLLVLVFVVDFIYGQYLGSYVLVSADSYVHLSRIVAILSQGFTIESGFFDGLAETGYHYNVIYALHATGSQALHLTPFDVWHYSFGFFRLLQWLAIFTLAHFILTRWIPFKSIALPGATAATILAMGLFGAYFFTAVYPNQVVNVWIILFILTLSIFESGQKDLRYVMVGLALLITLTHPTYALMTVAFIGLMLVIRFLLERRELLKQKVTLGTYAVVVGILMFGPIRTVLFPSRLNKVQGEIGAFPLWDVLGMKMKAPIGVIPITLVEFMLFALSIIGAGYLVVRLRHRKSQLAIMSSLLLLYPLIVYVPPFFTIAQKILPSWLIERFMAMDILMFVQVFFGLVALAVMIGTWGRKQKWTTFNKNTAYIFILVIILLIAGVKMKDSYQTLQMVKVENAHYYSFIESTYNNFKDVLKDEKVVVANQGDSYFLAAILPIDVIAVEAGHMTPVASADNRITCQQHILRSFEYANLKSVGASYVVLAKYDKANYSMQKPLADSKVYLKPVAQDENFFVYSVDLKLKSEGAGSPHKACIDYQRIETN